MKKTIFIAYFLLFCSLSTLSAGVVYDLSDFESSNTNFGVGNVQINGKNYFKLGANPDITIGALQVGLDLNLYLGDKVPSSLQSIVVRRIAYDHDHWAGAEWGRLQHVTYGYGLLVDNYDSGSFGSSEFNNDKAGVKAYLALSPIRLDGFSTAGKVMAGRLSYTLENSFVFGSPIVIGGTYIKDDNGIQKLYNQSTISRPAQEGWAADIGLPIGGQFFTPYVEYSELLCKEGSGGLEGHGIGTGIKGDFGFAAYRLEYRDLGKGFIPGYFNNTYEATTLESSQVPTEKITGFLGALSASLNDYIRAGVMYEDYKGRDAILTGSLGWHRIGNITGVVNYSAPFTGKNNAILNSDILYHTDGGIDYVVQYKKTYFPDGHSESSYGVSLRTSLKAFGLPF